MMELEDGAGGPTAEVTAPLLEEIAHLNARLAAVSTSILAMAKERDRYRSSAIAQSRGLRTQEVIMAGAEQAALLTAHREIFPTSGVSTPSARNGSRGA